MKKKTVLIIIGILVLLSAIGITLYFTLGNKTGGEETPDEPVYLEVVDKYGYTLEDRDTEYFKALFEDLKKILETEPTDYEAYAKVLAQLYITDLYTIENKVNVYDVGSVEYVYPDVRDDFILKVEDSIYKYVENNASGKRTQELPNVTAVEIVTIAPAKFKLGEKEYDSYTIELNIEYAKDLGYDKKATISIIKDGNMLYVVEQK